MATSLAIQQEALTRATSSQSLANYATIIRGFMAKGLSESEILPRENVFTYNAWKALGRQVKKGEHGVKCITVITTTDKRTGREERRPWTTTVFHVSQTEKIGTIACNEKLAELDATPENVPYAGEDEASRESGLDDAIAALTPAWTAAPVNTAELDAFAAAQPYKKYCEKCGSDDLRHPADILCRNCRALAEPKESASVRAMRGEQVSIMDMIDEIQAKPRPVQQAFALPRRLRSAVQSFQAKTVDF